MIKRSRKELMLFEMLYKKYYEKLNRVIYLITRDRNMTSDIIQESYIKAFTKIDQLKDMNKFEAWIIKIAINEAKNTLFKCSRQKIVSLETTNMTTKSMDKYKDFELQDIITNALNQLHPIERTIIILKYYSDFSIEEIAATLNLSSVNVKVKLHRTRARLKEILQLNDLENDVVKGGTKNG